MCVEMFRETAFKPLIYSILCCILLSHHYVEGQANKVSSKLDFDEHAEDRNNNNNSNNNQTVVPVLIGQGQQGQGQGQTHGQGQGGSNYDQGTGRGLGNGQTNSGGGGGNRPQIHGVRVTVDTGNGQQQTKESKESVEITDLGKHKKRVGIHTDITFEITAEGEANETSSAQQGEKEDASVPIFKGRGGSDSKHKTRKPYDPKSQWNPNFSSERRGYDSGGRGGSGGGGSRTGGYYPQYYPQHFYNSGGDTGSVYRSGETWTHYVPIWTTERSLPQYSEVYRRPNWNPCDYRRRRDLNQRSDCACSCSKCRSAPSSPST
ncbi:protein no-on-transient A [Scaptodrosophila lebanonensis]|uniref:Protein no-on-transient A n=1 Tax=Drosophila lebanonensis TaxID=7225 RepID=A0A6J2TQJ7_DROLE|nr:protein no-on-transient A [Scaptodrosophila lebanonensis]